MRKLRKYGISANDECLKKTKNLFIFIQIYHLAKMQANFLI
jgi:hypothetical protein